MAIKRAGLIPILNFYPKNKKTFGIQCFLALDFLKDLLTFFIGDRKISLGPFVHTLLALSGFRFTSPAIFF